MHRSKTLGRWVIEAGSQGEWINREGLEEYAIRWNWVDGPSSSGFTAVLRVKNEARSLPWVLPGVLRSVEQTIVVDNGSTDGTQRWPERLPSSRGMQRGLRLSPTHLWSRAVGLSICGPIRIRCTA